MTKSGSLVFVPLGGVGEIGMNLGLYGIGKGKDKTWLAVDMGVSFGKDDMPGIDAVLPDISYLKARRDKLAGIVITHAHEDHYGALFEFWPELEAPVFMTPFSAALLEAKRAGERGAPNIPVQVVEQGERVKIGPFEVEFVPMSHSIPEPNALAIRTEAGLVVHSGDWKLDPTPLIGQPTDEARLKELGAEGVDALICDSTNAIRDGVSPSELDVSKVLTEMIKAAPQRVAVTTFASNVARIRTIAEAAVAAGRETVVVGRSLRRSIDVATELGLLKGLPPFLDQDAYGYLPRNKVVALMTGSQGEPRAALARIASGDHREVTLASGDQVIFSSRTIPGNERSVNSIINALINLGAEIITDRDALVHVSGHPRRNELRALYGWLKPKTLVPVHGEALHLHAQARLGREEGIANVLEIRNGDVAELLPDPKVDGSVKNGKMLRDGRLLLDVEASGMRERRRLSYAGLVNVALALSESGEILDDPQVDLIGLPNMERSGQSILEIIEDAIDGAVDSLPKARRRDDGSVRDTVRRTVRGELDAVWGKKPMVSVLISRV